MYFYSPTKRGFTLIELIVSIGLFTVVALLASTALLSVTSSNRMARTRSVSARNMSFIFEDMIRSVRLGTIYHCGTGTLDDPDDCTDSASTQFAFEGYGGNPDSASDQIVYRKNGSALEKSINGGGQWTSITPGNVEITRFNVYVSGSESSEDDLQPQALIVVQGKVDEQIRERDFSFQTLAAQRVLDSSADFVEDCQIMCDQ